jgi:hypothetical protein
MAVIDIKLRLNETAIHYIGSISRSRIKYSRAAYSGLFGIYLVVHQVDIQ